MILEYLTLPCRKFANKSEDDGESQNSVSSQQSVWESSVGRKVVCSIGTVGWNTLSGAVDGYVVGSVSGAVFDGFILMAGAYGGNDLHSIMGVGGLMSSIYILGHGGKNCGAAIGMVNGIWKVLKN